MSYPQVFLTAEGDDARLVEEIRRSLRGTPAIHAPGWVTGDFRVVPGAALPPLVFARQWLPHAQWTRAASVRAWAQAVFEKLLTELPENQPWRLHLAPLYALRSTEIRGARAQYTRTRFRSATHSGSSRPTPEANPAATAGQHRCELIRETLWDLLRQRRRHLLKHHVESASPWSENDSLLQVILTSPESGWISLAVAPLPFHQARWLSPFPLGEVPLARDLAAPSRAFAKLVEAEQRLGVSIRPGETCVDLGAAPGSWTYVALQRGARVQAVDRAPLRDDLQRHPKLTHLIGDAFGYVPPQPVDWLLCDVIAAPERSIELVLEWVRKNWCRHFVVTIKFAGPADFEALQRLKVELATLRPAFRVQRLSANKNEACVFG